MKSQIPLMGALGRYFELPIPEQADGLLQIPGVLNLSIPPLFPVVPGAVGQTHPEGAFISSSLNQPAATAAADILVTTLSKGLYYVQWSLQVAYGLAAVAGSGNSNLFLSDPVSLRGFVLGGIQRGAALFSFCVTGDCWIPALTNGWQLRHSAPATGAGDFVNSQASILFSRVA